MPAYVLASKDVRPSAGLLSIMLLITYDVNIFAWWAIWAGDIFYLSILEKGPWDIKDVTHWFQYESDMECYMCRKCTCLTFVFQLWTIVFLKSGICELHEACVTTMEDVGECIDKDNMIQCTPYFGVTNVVMNGIEPGQGLEEK